MAKEIRESTETCQLCGGERVWKWLYIDGKFVPPGHITQDCECGQESYKRGIQMLRDITIKQA